MGKCSTINPDSEIYKSIYDEFKNFKTTNRTPFGRGVGGRDHWRSREIYQTVTHSVFRAQAQKIAQKVCQELKLEDYADDPADKADLTTKIKNSNNNSNTGNANNDVSDSSDEDDENYTSSINESSSDESLDGFFDEIELGEIVKTREPFLTEYPTRDKVLAIFPLDGDVLDSDGNQFEFSATTKPFDV